MVNKPTHAAVAANEASPTGQTKDIPQDAPPPYSGPSGSQPPPPQPVPLPQPHYLESGPPAHVQGQNHPHSHPQGGWAPPPTPQVARSRAIRRFWVAFLWAWLIWVFVGFVIGGGVSDMKREPIGRHGHWDKHGDWRDDATGYPYSWFGYGGADDRAAS